MHAAAAASWALECEGKGGQSSAPRVYVHQVRRHPGKLGQSWERESAGQRARQGRRCCNGRVMPFFSDPRQPGAPCSQLQVGFAPANIQGGRRARVRHGAVGRLQGGHYRLHGRGDRYLDARLTPDAPVGGAAAAAAQDPGRVVSLHALSYQRDLPHPAGAKGAPGGAAEGRSGGLPDARLHAALLLDVQPRA